MKQNEGQKRRPQAYFELAYIRTPLFVTLSIVLLYFSLYSLMQGLFLPSMSPSHLSIFASLLVGVLLSLFIVWALMFWLPSLRREWKEDYSFAPVLLVIRWIALVSLLSVSFIATWINPVLAKGALPLLWGSIVILFLFNLVLTSLGGRIQGPKIIFLQVVVDAILLSLCLVASSGVTNPFVTLFVFHSVIAALWMPDKKALQGILFLALVVMGMTLLDVSGLLHPFCLTIQQQCPHRSSLLVMASGLGVSFVILGCGLIVRSLVKSLRVERHALVRSSLLRGKEARALQVAQTELLAEKKKLQAVIEYIVDAVLVSDERGEVILYNRAALALAEDGEWGGFLSAVKAGLNEGAHVQFPWKGRSWEATYGQVDNEKGSLIGEVLVARDVTSRMKDAALRAEHERMATIGTLAASLAHEINNPLGSIQLYTQHALKHLKGEEPLSNYLETVLRNTTICKKTVRDLLDYSRQRAPEVRLLDARLLLQQAAQTVRLKAAKEGTELKLTLPDSAIMIRVDSDQWVQVLVNLALNAIEAMKEGPEEGRMLEFALLAEEGKARFLIKDQGPGIPKAQRDEIFSPFFTTKTEGTGLGLVVGRDIVRAHGGELWLLPDEEEKGEKGATFVMEVPIDEAK